MKLRVITLEKIEERIKNWIIITFFLIVNIIMITLFIDNFLLPNLKVLNVAQWDLLAFLGSLFGGLVTYLAVVYTIKENRRNDYIDAYPSKHLAAQDVISKLDRFLHGLHLAHSKNSNYILAKEIQSFINDKEELFEKAAIVGGRSYHIILNFFSDSELWMQSAEKVFEVELPPHLFLDNERYKAFELERSIYLKEIERLTTKYNKILKN
jgi:hypothetical protein